MRTTTLCATLALTLFALSACSASEDKSHKDSGVKVAFGGDSASRAPAMGPDDVKITSSDGALMLSVIGDTVRMQLSDSLRKSVADKVDSGAASKGGIGGMIAKSVNSVVQSAMGFVVRVPATEVKNLRYEDGHLRFDTEDERNNKVHVSGNEHDNARFNEADAKRFIAAVEKRQHKMVEK
jgi:hypothetical protein